MSKGSLRSKPSFRERMMTGSSRPGTMGLGGGKGPKEFYCTVFGQMDKTQTNLAVVLRTYFYPREEFTGQMKHVEERWDDNPSFKIICNHEINSDPPSVMLCNPVRVKSKPGCQFRIDLLNQEAFLDTAEFYADGPQLPKCLQFDISLASYNIDTMASPAALASGTSDQIPAIKIIRSPDESEVGEIPLVHLCDIPDAAMTGSFSFDDFCYTMDPKPRFGTKIEHNRTWHRLPQLLVKFMSEDRELSSKVMEIAKEWERHTPGIQILQCPKDASRDAQIRIKFSSRNQCAIGTDAEDVPIDKPTMHLNVARDTHPVIFRRRVLHQFGHALGLYHEFECVPETVEWDEANIQLDTSMEAGWSTAETKNSLIRKESCTNGDNFDRLSIMTVTYKRSYIKGWLPRQHQSILSVDDKTLVNALYPPPGETHRWSDPLASPDPVDEEESEEESEEEEEEVSEWKKAAMDREGATPVDMFSGVFADQGSDPQDAQRARMRSSGVEFEPTDSGKKVAQKSASALFEFEPTAEGKKQIKAGTRGSFIEYVEPKYTREELDNETREGDFFSFRDMKNLRELELPSGERAVTPLFSPPETPDSMPDSLAPTPTSKLFLSDAFADIREEWLTVQQEQMIQITQESTPGTRGQKVKLQPGDILYRDADENRDIRGEMIQEDTFGRKHQEASLFGERTNVVSPSGIVEREHFYKTLNRLSTGQKEEDMTFNQQYQEVVKEQNRQEEFFRPSREFIGDEDIKGMGFDENKRALRSERRVEYEPADDGKKVMVKGKGKGKGKGKKQKEMAPVDEAEEESFYTKAYRMKQTEQEKIEEDMSFRARLDKRGDIAKPISTGLKELQPVDEDIFDLLDRAQREGHGAMVQNKFVPQNQAPALISTKGSFQGIGGSGSLKENGWQSFYDYAEEDMINYEYQEAEEDNSMDLVSFRNRLAQRSGVTQHEGIGISPANNRQYLESPVPVANRTVDTEHKISMRSEKRGNKEGRYYDDEVDLVDPNDLVDEALDRGFGKGGEESEDEISREKKAASKKYYGIGKGGEADDYDDVAATKRKIKSDAQRSQKSASKKSHLDGFANVETKSIDSEAERARFGFATATNRNAGQYREYDSPNESYNMGTEQSKIEIIERQNYKSDGTGRQSEQHQEEQHTSRADTQKLSEGHASSQGSVEGGLNWNVDSTHVKREKTFSETTGVYTHDKHEHSAEQKAREGSRKSAQSSKKEAETRDEEDDSPFLPPITPKKPKQQPKFVVQSREIATQITADALVPTQVVPDYWISKDTAINRKYDDLALRRANIQTGQSQLQQSRLEQQQQSRLEYEDRPMTYRSTFTDYDPPTEAQQGFEFEAISDEEQGDVYSRLNDGKAYQKDAGTDLWMQKTDISFTVLLYLKKNLGINWKRAGQYLGISRERLRRIEDIGIANARTGIEKMAQDMLFEWAEKDPQPTVAKLCAALEAADLSKLSQGVMDKVQKEKKSGPAKRRKAKAKGEKKGRKVDESIKVPISEETIPYRVMVYLKDNLGESWKDLAVCLKIPSPKIKAIEAEAWQVEKMAYDMLHEWRQRDKEHATVDRLIEALEKAQCKKLVKGVAARSQSYHFRIAA